MNTPDPSQQPDFDEDFTQALENWKRQHHIKDDDTILVLMDLFRIHQSHWDEIRHRQMPSLAQFKTDIAALAEATTILKKRATKEARAVNFSAAIFAAIAAALAGFLIGKFL